MDNELLQKFKNARKNLDFPEESQSMNADLCKVYQLVTENISDSMQSMLFTDSFSLEAFIHYLYFETMIGLFYQNSPAKPVNFYVTEMIRHCTKNLSPNDLTADYFNGNVDKPSMVKKNTRKIHSMLVTSELSPLERSTSCQNTSPEYKQRLLYQLNTKNQAARFPCPIPLSYFYQACSEYSLRNDNARGYIHLSEAKTTSDEITKYYQKCAVFVDNILLSDDNFSQNTINQNDDYAARAVALVKLESFNKLYTIVHLAHILASNNERFSVNCEKLKTIYPFLSTRFHTKVISNEYSGTVLEPLIESAIELLNAKDDEVICGGPPKYLAELIIKMVFDSSTKTESLTTIVQYRTYMLLMAYFRSIIISDHLIQYDINKFCYNIQKYNL